MGLGKKRAYGNRWYHISHHSRFCFPWSIRLGAESIGMGIRVSPRGLLHKFRLPLLGSSGNCDPNWIGYVEKERSL